MKWEYLCTVGGYRVWSRKVRDFGQRVEYNVTKDENPPNVESGGYYNLDSLLRLKGVKA